MALLPLQICVRPLDLALHEIEVEISLPAEAVTQGAVVALAAWTPGSYLVRDYARFLDRVSLRNSEGTECGVTKLDKQRWELSSLSQGGVLTYRLFCNDLTVRTNHVDARHAHLVGAASFPVLEGQEQRPCHVRFEGWPPDWQVACSLPEYEGGYLAADYDTLVDSPFELGRFRRYEWNHEGTDFELVITGEHNGDEVRILEGTREIVAVCGGLFGGFPFERYVFLLTFSPGTRGGLEHRDSTSLLADAFAFDRPEGYYDLFTLIAHEFFHAWNVKRLRAPELGPFDYSRENPTRLLWFHEGFTSFMQYGLVLQAGVAPWTWVARKLGATWTEYTQRRGRLEQSLEESSFDAWIRHYKPTEFSANSTVSYYEKGALVAWMMDARIRLASQGAKGLEHLFRLLWERFGDGPVADRDLRQAYQELALESPDGFWAAHIEGVAELDASAICQAYGLRFEQLAPWELAEDDAESQRRARVYTGLTFSGEGCVIHSVEPGSAAALAGLSYGQEILAVDGWRTANAADIQRRFRDRAPGNAVPVLAVDRGRVHSCLVLLEEHPHRVTRIQTSAQATNRQREAFLSWTGQRLSIPQPPAWRSQA